MNSVHLIGRLTRQPQLQQSKGGNSYCRFSVAIDRGNDKNGNDLGADFPSVTVFGRQAENLAKYLDKGRLVSVEGRIRTDKYNKDGKDYYTEGIIAERVQFLDWGKRDDSESAKLQSASSAAPQGFVKLENAENREKGGNMPTAEAGFANGITDDDIPF